MEKKHKESGMTGTHFFGPSTWTPPPVGIRRDGTQTNAAFAKEAAHFAIACRLVWIRGKDGTRKQMAPTTRQASKFRRCEGAAYMAWLSAGKPVSMDARTVELIEAAEAA